MEGDVYDNPSELRRFEFPFGTTTTTLTTSVSTSALPSWLTPPTMADSEANTTQAECQYWGTDYIEGKIFLIGVFATAVALLSIIFNTFNCVVYVHSPSLRRSAVFYFGILSLIDIIMGFNYIAIMSMPVFFDYYKSAPLYHLFLWYFRVVLVESNCAIFASVLLILLATSERLLRTFTGKKVVRIRRFVEKHRVSICICVILVASAYKLCTFFEITYVEHPHCEDDFSRYEITATELVLDNPDYRFWWMFLTRFIVERLLPFFILVFMNFAIIKALKRQTFESKLHFSAGSSTKNGRRHLRDATRTLIVMVSMYIIAQTPQVVLTIWEAFDKETLMSDENHQLYSYMNDIMSICTLLSSCLRFPVCCATNRQIAAASFQTAKDWGLGVKGQRDQQHTHYAPIANSRHKNSRGDCPTAPQLITPSSEMPTIEERGFPPEEESSYISDGNQDYRVRQYFL